LPQFIERTHHVGHHRLVGAHLFTGQRAVVADDLSIWQVRQDPGIGLHPAQDERAHDGAKPG
jgi:hypothetical protein